MPAAPGRHRDGEARHAEGVPPARREVMANGRRHGNRDTQFGPERREARAIDLDPSAGGLHQGARQHECRNSDAVYMAATDQTPDPNKALAPREPSIQGSREPAKDADVYFGSLAVEVSCGDAFTKGFQAAHLRLDPAAGVVSSPSFPERAAVVTGGTQRLVADEAVWKLGRHSLLGRNFSQFADFGSDWSHAAFWMPPRA